MPRKGWSTALVLAACSSPNPAYQAPGVEGETEATDGPVGQDEATGGTTTGSTHGGAEATAEGSDDEDDGEDGPSVAERCAADLYALTEDGAIHLVDLDTATTVLLLQSDDLQSWAFATHPITGLLYVSPLDEPNLVWVVDPLSFEMQATVLETTNPEELIRMSRADFDSHDQLWIGTNNTNWFFSVSPSDGASVGQSVSNIGSGGDMVFIQPSLALVPSFLGDLSQVDLSSGAVDPFPIEGLTPNALLTGIAFDLEQQLWIAQDDGLLLRVDHERRMVMETLELDIAVSDLAPIVMRRDECP